VGLARDRCFDPVLIRKRLTDKSLRRNWYCLVKSDNITDSCRDKYGQQEMTEEIQFKGWITFEDALRVERLLTPRKFWSVSGVTTIAVMAAIAVNVMRIQTSWPFTVLFLLITSGFSGGLFWLMDRSNMKAKRNHYDRSLIERKGTLGRDKITVETDKTKTEMRWDFFDKVIEAEDLVLVATDKEYMAFAPYMFTTKGDWVACQIIIRKNQRESQPEAGGYRR